MSARNVLIILSVLTVSTLTVVVVQVAKQPAPAVIELAPPDVPQEQPAQIQPMQIPQGNGPVCLTWTSQSLPGFNFGVQTTLSQKADGLWHGHAMVQGGRWGFAYGEGSVFNKVNPALNLTPGHWYAFLGSGTWNVAPWHIDLAVGSITNNTATVVAGACGP